MRVPLAFFLAISLNAAAFADSSINGVQETTVRQTAGEQPPAANSSGDQADAEPDPGPPVAEQEAPDQTSTEPQDDTPDIDTESTIDVTRQRRGLRIFGDIRPILDASNEDSRDGTTDKNDSPGIRARLAMTFGVTPYIHFGARLAGFGVGGLNASFVNLRDVADDDIIDNGEFTFDQLYFHWMRLDQFDLAFGRLQTRFVLRGGVFAKSLDRNDSNNINVTWTDGLHATRRKGKWVSHFIAEDNSSSSSILRFPLTSDEYTLFYALENQKRLGPIVQRGIDISYIPDELLKDGSPEGGRLEDYWGVVGRIALRHPQQDSGFRWRIGAEIGYAPETPTRAARFIPGSGDTDGLAWNVVISAMEFSPGHSIGLNYGRTGAGWLLSPQFRPNEELIELRYQLRTIRSFLLEARIRRRQELDQLIDSVRKRTEYDFYLRLTWKFVLRDA